MSSETILNNRYRLVAQQGSGGMAVIYKAIDQVLGRTVAIKILRPSLTNDPAFLARFRNEARSVANLQHPNIVTVHDVGNEGATHYIVMEFIEGQDLKKIIKASGALPTERALNLGIQICAGIGFAHRAGIVHADVKPQNMLVTKDDLVKVTDFGIAQAFSEAAPGERQQIVWGSPHYFAPEQARGEKPTPASDVYSIGIVLFEMLTGRLPFIGNNQQELALAHIREAAPLVSDLNPSVPENIVQIVHKVMSKEPGMRYRMADQLGRILESYRDRGRQYTQPNIAISNTPPPSVPTVQNQQPVTGYPTGQTPPPNAVPTQLNLPPVMSPQSTLPQGVEPLPTQRVELAPNAPSLPFGNRAQPVPTVIPNPYEPAGVDSRRLQTGSQPVYPPPNDRQTDLPPVLDLVTIALAILAFFAVACLIPLYIAVLQAYLG
ncbi:MAG: protein kinase [Anaerolineae bacterium]|nr:protein kinase [Anaerolineae bacterium]